MSRWKWRRKSDGEPLTRITVEHYMSRGDMEDALASSNVRTGTVLGDRALIAAVKDMLASADALEAFQYWPESCQAEEAEIDERAKWAQEQVAAYYERTSG